MLIRYFTAKIQQKIKSTHINNKKESQRTATLHIYVLIEK